MCQSMAQAFAEALGAILHNCDGVDAALGAVIALQALELEPQCYLAGFIRRVTPSSTSLICLSYKFMRRLAQEDRRAQKRVAAADAIDTTAGHRRSSGPLRVEDAYFIAARTSLATSSMSSAFSAGNGRFMSSSSSTVLPPTETTKAPLRGFSLFTSTVTPGRALASRFALVLNAPQLLQASTDTTPPLDDLEVALALAAVGFLAGALALVFFAMAALAMDLHASQRAGDRLKAEPAASSAKNWESTH